MDIDIKIKKLVGFEKRIAEIYHLLEPKKEWDIVKKDHQEDSDRNRYINLSRRLLEQLSSNPTGNDNRDTLIHLERLMQHRLHREEHAQNQPPPRQLNINDIYQQLEEFTNPIVP